MKKLSSIRQNSVSNIDFLNDSLEFFKEDGIVENKQAVYDFISVVNADEISRLTNLITNNNLVVFMPRETLFIAQSFKMSLQKIGIDCKVKSFKKFKESELSDISAGSVAIFSDAFMKEKNYSNCINSLKKTGVTVVKIQNEAFDVNTNEADINLYTLPNRMRVAVNYNLQLECLAALMDCIYINLLLKININ